VYYSLLTGYLIVAYLAGSKLQVSQVLFISVLFLVFSGGLTLASFLDFSRAIQLSVSLAEIDSSMHTPISPSLPYALIIVQIFGIVGSLHFMYGVRARAKKA
jgi:hypothetical protein